MPESGAIAGANGAGKTTFARQFLPVFYPDVSFLNVDEIQMEDAGFAHPVAASAAPEEFSHHFTERVLHGYHRAATSMPSMTSSGVGSEPRRADLYLCG